MELNVEIWTAANETAQGMGYIEADQAYEWVRKVEDMQARYMDLVRHLDNILVELEDTGCVMLKTMGAARKELTEQGWGEDALGALADHNEEQTMNIYEWANDRNVDVLAAHAIAYHFAGYKDEDNPFTSKGSFYRTGWTSIRDDNNPVPHQWSTYLFDREATIASCLDGMQVVDPEELDKMKEELNEQASVSYKAMQDEL